MVEDATIPDPARLGRKCRRELKDEAPGAIYVFIVTTRLLYCFQGPEFTTLSLLSSHLRLFGLNFRQVAQTSRTQASPTATLQCPARRILYYGLHINNYPYTLIHIGIARSTLHLNIILTYVSTLSRIAINPKRKSHI